MTDLINKISNGKAILFVGAGFSKSATNLNNNELPVTSDLAMKISKLGNFADIKDLSNNLKDATDYYINKYCDNDNERKNDLITMLQKEYTIKEAHSEHNSILKVPWKRIYTTNYDDLIEISARNNNNYIKTVNIDDSTEINTNNNICIHLNGSISTLSTDTLDTSFKLSQQSYLSSESFEESNWNYIFQKDLEFSSAIVFIGYSLYDIAIEKILSENQELKKKVYFIRRPESEDKDYRYEDFKFDKYGISHKIGVNGFAQVVEKNIKQITSRETNFLLEAFEEYEISSTTEEQIRENDIEIFLKYGDIENRYLEQGIVDDNTIPFIIKRTKLDDLVELLKKNKIICITSELGNGKSIFLRETALQLTLEGYSVFVLSDTSGNYIADIDKIISSNKNATLIIDTYGNFPDIVNHIIKIDLGKIKIILSERTSRHYQIVSDSDDKLQTKDLNIDILDDEEIDKFINILEHTSLWGQYGGKTKSQKRRLIEDKHKKQISSVLIDVLKSNYIKNEISKLLKNSFKDEKMKKYIFATCLLDIMNIPASLALVENLSQDTSLLSKFSSQKELRSIFTLNLLEHEINTKSSIYSLHIINEHFNPSYIIDQCLSILKDFDKKFAKDKTLDFARDSIRTNLFRFNFIEKILPISTKREMLIRYFERIKNDLPFHIHNPQYWLQYAMAYIAMKNYDKADRYIQNAYDKAKHRDYYDEHKIDNQKARLNLKVASLNTTPMNEAIKLFIAADTLLSRLNNDVYKFKVVMDYKDFVDSREKSFSKENKKIVISACKTKLSDIESLKKFDINNFKQERLYQVCKARLEHLISTLSNKT